MNQQIFFWVLYDFANSFLSAAIEGLYFSQWVVIDNGFPDIWFGSTFALATFLLLVTSPFLGAWSDFLGRKMPFLKTMTFLTIISALTLALIANSQIKTDLKVYLALASFFFVQLFYQSSLIFYNPLLNQVSSKNNLGFISGIGQLTNNLGFVLATGLFLLIVQKDISLFGSPGRNQVFLPATLVFGVLSLFFLFRFKEKSTTKLSKEINFKSVYAKIIVGLGQLWRKDKNIGFFLIAFMLISDAILTANLFFAIFMDQVYKVSDTTKFILITIMGILVIPSCYISGKLADRIGLKKVLVFSCLMLAFSFLFISLSTSISLLYFLIIPIGIGWGGYYTTARAMLVDISPKNRLGEFFGFYSIFQKSASIVGPLIWGITTLLLMDLGNLKYRIAVILLVIMMFLGIGILLKVKENKQVVYST